MFGIRPYLALSIVVIVLCATQIALCGGLSADEILQKCADSLINDRTVSFHDDCWRKSDKPWAKPIVSWEHTESTVYYEDKGRLAGYHRDWRNLESDSVAKQGNRYQETHSLYLPNESRIYGAIYMVEAGVPRMDLNPKFLSIANATDFQVDHIRASRTCAREFDGYFGPSDVMPIFLRKLKPVLGEKMDVVGKSQCYVIRSADSNGQFTVWIDPAHGFCIAKLEQVQQGHDVVNGQAMPLPGITGGGRIVYLASSYEVTSFQQVEGAWIPSTAKASGETRFEFGTVGKAASVLKRSDVTFGPHFEAKVFDKSFPDGLPVGDMTEKHELPRIWRNGQVELAINPATTQNIDKSIQSIQQH